MTTTPPYPDEPEDPRDEAQQASDRRRAETGWQYRPPSQPQQPAPGQEPEQAGGSMSGPADWQSFSRPAESFGQSGEQQVGQYGSQPGEQPFTLQYGQAGAQHFTQPPGRQQFGDPNAAAGYSYGQSPPVPPLSGAQQAGYGYGQIAGPAAMPPYAGWWKRVGAYLLDNVLVGVALGLITEPTHNSALEGLTSAIAVIWSLYNAFLAGSRGQSYGKRAVGIRLARMQDGTPVGGGYGLLRWLMNGVFTLLCFVPGVLNYLWPLWDANHQTWSDKIAGSVVVQA
ncbi:MAG TPA: RDD family protein [Actinocrinis sp.]|nr:RDD family protein [Actinocrinis sp.]